MRPEVHVLSAVPARAHGIAAGLTLAAIGAIVALII
jgi:hypothetical protein